MKLTLHCALNTVTSGAANVMGLSVELWKGARYFSTIPSTTDTTTTTSTTATTTTMILKID